eukprot:CAMPEP_0202914612 /NCGR_PEP_ID=MMETSP1392-20130828/63538_1 /ASSEMBLY_ACC=CAM_ASM_000868 /TAXON_ID=225041 /ORGANISM="Chlamydomonas chlamydogama, Strain SAG 11-48b" /LENGTH=153 /DNA_ID=CAMNT_0049606323 /DNA_START=1690 /DNA_END=2150 /DNA_ORIENTATION=+
MASRGGQGLCLACVCACGSAAACALLVRSASLSQSMGLGEWWTCGLLQVLVGGWGVRGGKLPGVQECAEGEVEKVGAWRGAGGVPDWVAEPTLKQGAAEGRGVAAHVLLLLRQRTRGDEGEVQGRRRVQGPAPGASLRCSGAGRGWGQYWFRG